MSSAPALVTPLQLPAAVIAELADLFETDSAAELSALKHAFESSDVELAMRRLHALKGAAGNLGMTLMYALTHALEEEIRTSACITPLRGKLEVLEECRAHSLRAFREQLGP